MARPNKATCGTHSGWQKHQREKTTFCEPCLEARRAFKRFRYTLTGHVDRKRSRKNNRIRRARKKENKSLPYKESAVLKIHGPFCWICGGKIDLKASRKVGADNWEMSLHIDHVVPLALGGSDDIHNVRPAHGICNISKGAKMPDDVE
jgi:5-methylcytosine-specific restriction endonuclease McrA